MMCLNFSERKKLQGFKCGKQGGQSIWFRTFIWSAGMSFPCKLLCHLIKRPYFFYLSVKFSENYRGIN